MQSEINELTKNIFSQPTSYRDYDSQKSVKNQSFLAHNKKHDNFLIN
jgi:hypothetical protein